MSTRTWFPGDRHTDGRTAVDPDSICHAGDVPRVGFGWAKGQPVAVAVAWIALAEHRAIVAQLEAELDAALDELARLRPAVDPHR